MRTLSLFLLGCAALAQTQPELFAPGVISTPDYELDASFTPDGRTLYFTKSTPQFGTLLTIVVSRLRDGKWSKPEVAEFSGQWSDADPFVSPDGRRLFFISTRPVDGKPKKDNDIWVMDKVASGWSEPRNLGAPVNTAGRELYPTVTRDGTLYFVSSRPGGLGGSDIYRARLVNGKYAEPENLGPAINSRFNEGDAYIAPDESYLIFTSAGRPDDLGGGDLYISFRKNGVWTPARHLGAGVNSSAREFCPIGSPDGKYLYFTSERGFGDTPPDRRLTYKELEANLRGIRNHLGNIWRIDLKAVAGDAASAGPAR
jgi:Tol biopolymer transport system component